MDGSPFPSSSSKSLLFDGRPGNANLLDESGDFMASSKAGSQEDDTMNFDDVRRASDAPRSADAKKGKSRETADGQDARDGRGAEDLVDGMQDLAIDKALDGDRQAGPVANSPAPLSEEELAHMHKRRREEALTRERDELASMNTVLEGAIAGLETALPKIDRFAKTISTTHSLLDTYVKILSQTEHTQRLLLDGRWEMSRDLEEIQAAQDAAERARREEIERREGEKREQEERERRAVEEAQRKAALAAKPPARGRGTSSRGTGSSIGRGRGGAGTGTTSRGIARGTGTRGRGTSGTARGAGRGTAL